MISALSGCSKILRGCLATLIIFASVAPSLAGPALWRRTFPINLEESACVERAHTVLIFTSKSFKIERRDNGVWSSDKDVTIHVGCYKTGDRSLVAVAVASNNAALAEQTASSITNNIKTGGPFE
jgi:hypothetical protein